MIEAERFRTDAIERFRKARARADFYRDYQARYPGSNAVKTYAELELDALDFLTEVGLSEDQLAYLYRDRKIDSVELRQYSVEDLIEIGIEQKKAMVIKGKYPDFPPRPHVDTYAHW